MTLDFGAHLYPKSVFPSAIADSPLAEMLGDLLSDPASLREQYAAAEIGGAVLSQPYYMGAADLTAVEAANDALRDVLAPSDDIFGLAAIPVTAGGSQAAAEFERCLEDGYHGGALETKTRGVELTDGDLTPVFEVAERWDAPVLVHPKLDESLHPDALSDKYLLNAIFGREAALSESICKVIHEGVLDDHPDLTLVYHHLGGNIASMLGRVNLQLAEDRWPGQEAVKPFDAFESQLQERIYVDTSGFYGYQAPLENALDVFAPSKVLFATDYPFEYRSGAELDRAASVVRNVVPGEHIEDVLSGNARSLLANT